MNRVVILGSSGFVGRALSQELATQGFEVLGLTSKDLDLAAPDAGEKLKQTVKLSDTLVFVSALTPDKGRDAKTILKNLVMGEAVASFLEQMTLNHFVYISSDAVYDDGAHLVRETTLLAPQSNHGYMHLGRELMLKQAFAKSKTPSLILRPTAVYGAGDTHNSYGPNRFIRTALKDRKITLFGEGEEQRDHIFIDDLSRFAGLCIKNRTTGALNVATGKAVSFFEVATAVANAVGADGRKVEIECLPRSGPITHKHFDLTETMRAFPTFQFTSLEEGIKRSLLNA